MTSFAQELLSVDRQRLDLRAGVLGLVVLSAFAVAIAVVGPEALESTGLVERRNGWFETSFMPGRTFSQAATG